MEAIGGLLAQVAMILQLGIGGVCAQPAVDAHLLGQDLEGAVPVRAVLVGVAPTCSIGG